jgi:hypothetical protein
MSNQYNDGNYVPNANDYADLVMFYNNRPPLYTNTSVPVVSVKEGEKKYYNTGCQEKTIVYGSPFRYGYNGLSGDNVSGADYFSLYNAYSSR